MPDNVKAASLAGPLDGFARESTLAAELGVHVRTLARARKKAGIRFLLWGGEIWDHCGDVGAYVASRVTRRNPPRPDRRRRRSSSENRDNV